MEWCSARLAGYKRPKTVSFITDAQMPRIATGKIQHRILKSRLEKVSPSKASELDPDVGRQARRAAFRRLEKSLSQGAEWKALISRYITTIPFSGKACCVAEQSISDGPPSMPAVSSAITAKVGGPARDRRSIAPMVAVPVSQPTGSRMHLPVSASRMSFFLQQTSSCR